MRIGRPRSDNGPLTLVPFNVSERAAITAFLGATNYAQLKIVATDFHNWVWDKGDMLIWTPVLNRIDRILLQYVRKTGLHQLPGNHLPPVHDATADNFVDDFDYENDEDLDRQCVIKILKVLQIIIDSCTAKAMFNSVGMMMLLLDSCDPNICQMALFIIIIAAFVARKGKRPSDAPWISEVLRRLRIMALPPARAVGSDLEAINPLLYYAQLHWRAGDDFEQSYRSVVDSSEITLSNRDLRKAIEQQLGDISGDGVRFEQAFVELSLRYKIQCPRELRHRVRILVNDSLVKRRCLLDNQLLVQMAIMSFAPNYFQTEIAQSDWFFNELALLSRSHRELSYFTVALISDTWLNLMSEKVMVKQVGIHLQLVQPHGLFFELLSTYISDRLLFPSDPAARLKPDPIDGSIQRLPELLSEERDTSSDGSASAPHDRTHGKKHADTRVRRAPTAVDEENDVLIPEHLPRIICFREVDCLEHPHAPDDITSVALSSKDLYLRLSRNRTQNQLAIDSEGKIVDPHAIYSERVRNHADLVTALLDLYQELLFSCPTPALCSAQILKTITSLIEVRDYRYLQTCMSALRSIEAYYDNSALLTVTRTNLRDINLVERCARRLRYELAHIHELVELARAENWIDQGEYTVTPWTAQGTILASGPNAAERLDAAVSKYMSLGSGVPSSWQARDLSGSHFWQFMEELSNRRALTSAIIKDGPVLQWYPDTQTSISADLVDEFGLAFRYIFTQNAEVSCGVVSAAIQSLCDIRSEDPSSQKSLTDSYIMESFYKAVPELIRSESCMSFIPSLLTCQHRLGVRDLMRHKLTPIHLLIEHSASPLLTYYDRVNHITASIGQTLESAVKEAGPDFAEPIAAKFESILCRLRDELYALPAWRQRTDAMVEIKRYLEESSYADILIRQREDGVRQQDLTGLSLPETPAHQYLVDRIANISRTLQTVVHGCLPLYFPTFASKCLPVLLEIACALPDALPPMAFSACVPTHPIIELVKTLLSCSCEQPSTPASMLIFGELKSVLYRAAEMNYFLNDNGNLKEALQLSSAQVYPNVSPEVQLKRETFIKLAHTLGTSLSIMTGAIKEKALLVNCFTEAQLPILLGLSTIVPLANRVLQDLLHVIYADLIHLEHCKDCPMVLVFRGSIHEPPQLIAAKADARRDKKNPITDSACFHLPSADPISTSIGRPCLGQHAFLWSTVCDYAYSSGNALLDDNIPIETYDTSSYAHVETTRSLEQQRMSDGEGGLTGSVPAWQSDSLIKEVIRTVCVSVRGFLSACARATAVQPRYNPAREIHAVQSLIGVHLGNLAKGLLADIPEWPAPAELVAPSFEGPLLPIDNLEHLIRKACYLAECWDILYRTHVDEKASSTSIAPPIDAAVKLGFADDARRAILFINNLHCAIQCEIVRRLFPQFRGAVFGSGGCTSQWLSHQRDLAHQLSSVDSKTLEIWLPLVEKAYQSTASYSEKITSWRRIATSNSIKLHVKPKRISTLECNAPMDVWLDSCGRFHAFDMLNTCLKKIAMTQFECWNAFLVQVDNIDPSSLAFHLAVVERFGSSKSLGSVLRCLQYIFMPLEELSRGHAAAWRRVHDANGVEESDKINLSEEYLSTHQHLLKDYSARTITRAISACGEESFSGLITWLINNAQSQMANSPDFNVGGSFGDDDVGEAMNQLRLDEHWFDSEMPFGQLARGSLVVSFALRYLPKLCRSNIIKRWLGALQSKHAPSDTHSSWQMNFSDLWKLEAIEEYITFEDYARLAETLPAKYIEGIIICSAQNPTRKQTIADAIARSLEVLYCIPVPSTETGKQPMLWHTAARAMLDGILKFVLADETGWLFGLPAINADAAYTTKLKTNYALYLASEGDELSARQLASLKAVEDRDEISISVIRAYAAKKMSKCVDEYLPLGCFYQRLYAATLDAILMMKSAASKKEKAYLYPKDELFYLKSTFDILRVAVDHRKRLHQHFFESRADVGFAFLDKDCGVGGVPSWTLRPDPYSPVFGVQVPEERIGPYVNNEKLKRRNPSGRHGSAAAMNLPPLQHQAPEWLVSTLSILALWNELEYTPSKPNILVLLDVASIMSGMSSADFRALMLNLIPLAQIYKLSGQILSHKVFFVESMTNTELLNSTDGHIDPELKRIELLWLPRGLGAILRMPKNGDSPMTLQNVAQFVRFVAEDQTVILHNFRKAIETAFNNEGVELELPGVTSAAASVATPTAAPSKVLTLAVGELERLCSSCIQKAQGLFETVVAAICILRRSEVAEAPHLLLQLAPPNQADARFKKLIETKPTTQSWQVVTTIIQHLKLFTSIHAATYKIPLIAQLNTRDRLRVDQAFIKKVNSEGEGGVELTSEYKLPPYLDLEELPEVLKAANLDSDISLGEQLGEIGAINYRKKNLLYPYSLTSDSLLFILYHLFNIIPDLHQALSKTPPQHVMADASPGIQRTQSLKRSTSGNPDITFVIVDIKKLRLPHSIYTGTLFRQIIRDCSHGLMARALPNYTDNLADVFPESNQFRNVIYAPEDLVQTLMTGVAKNQRFLNQEVSTILKFTSVLLLVASQNLEIRRKLCCEVLGQIRILCASRLKRSKSEHETQRSDSQNQDSNEDAVVILSYYTGVLLLGLLNLPMPVGVVPPAEEEVVLSQFSFSSQERASLRPAVSKLIGRLDLKRLDTIHIAQIWAWTLTALTTPFSLDCELRIPTEAPNTNALENKSSEHNEDMQEQVDDGGDEVDLDEDFGSDEGVEILLADEDSPNYDSSHDESHDAWLGEEDGDYSGGDSFEQRMMDDELLFMTEVDDEEADSGEESYSDNQSDVDLLGLDYDEGEEEDERAELPHEETTDAPHHSASLDGLVTAEDDEDFDEERDEIPRLREEEITRGDDEGLEGEEFNRSEDDRGDQTGADLWEDSVELLPGLTRFGIRTKVTNSGQWWAIETAARVNPYFEHWTSRVNFGTVVTGSTAVIGDLWPHPNFPILLSERTWLTKPDRIVIDIYDGNRCFQDPDHSSEWWQSIRLAGEWSPPTDASGSFAFTELEQHLLKKCDKNMMRLKLWREPVDGPELNDANDRLQELQGSSDVQSGSPAEEIDIEKAYINLTLADKLTFCRLAREEGERPTSGILRSRAFEALAFGLGLSERQLIDILELDESVFACLPEDLQEEALAGPLETLTIEALRTKLRENMLRFLEHNANIHRDIDEGQHAVEPTSPAEQDNQEPPSNSPMALRILTVVRTAPQAADAGGSNGDLTGFIHTSGSPVDNFPYSLLQNTDDRAAQDLLDAMLAEPDVRPSSAMLPMRDLPQYTAISELWLTIVSEPVRHMIAESFRHNAIRQDLGHRLDSFASVMDRLSNLLSNIREGTRRIEITRHANVRNYSRPRPAQDHARRFRPLIPSSVIPNNTDTRARLVHLEPNSWRYGLANLTVTPAIIETILPASTSLAGTMRLLYLCQQVSRRALHALFHNLCSASPETCLQVVTHFVFLIWQAAPDIWLDESPSSSPMNSSTATWYPLRGMVRNGEENSIIRSRAANQIVAARVLEFLQSLLHTCPTAIMTAFTTPVLQPKFFELHKGYMSATPASTTHKRRKNETGSNIPSAAGESDYADVLRPVKKTRLEDSRSVTAELNRTESGEGSPQQLIESVKTMSTPIRIFVNMLRSTKMAESGYLATCLTNTLSSILSGGELQGRQTIFEAEQLIETLTGDDMELIIRSCFHRRCDRNKLQGCEIQNLWRDVQSHQTVFPNLVLKNGIVKLYNSAKRQQVTRILTECICEVVNDAVRSVRKLQSTLPERESDVAHTLNSYSQLSVETDLSLLAKALVVLCDATLMDEAPNLSSPPRSPKKPKSAEPDEAKEGTPPQEAASGLDDLSEKTSEKVSDESAPIPKDRWQIHRVANLFSGIDQRTGVWQDLDQILTRIEDRYPELVSRHTLTADIGLAGNEEHEPTSPTPPAHTTHRQRKTTITQDVLNAPPQLGALPTIVNRLLPLLEAYVFVHTVQVADELGEYYLLPCFFQMSSRDLANSTRILRWGKKDVFRNESGSIVMVEDYAMFTLRIFEEKLRKIFYSELVDVTDPDLAPSSPTPSHSALMDFCQRHCIAINALIRQTPTLITSVLAPLIYMAPNAIWFDNKRLYFRVKMKHFKEQQMAHNSSAPIRLTVRRSDVFVDTYNALRRYADQLHSKIIVSFKDEPGIDAGGLTREWYTILSHEIFNPNYTLFQQHGCKSEFNYPNPLSYITHNHLDLFYFCGQIIAKAIYDGYYLDAYFTRPFYKIILDRQLNIPHDAESIDPIFYKNLLSLTALSDQDLKDLDLRFTYDVNEFGINHSHELIPKGKDIVVEKSNLSLYINKLAKFKITFGIEKQIENFLKGFYSLIPKHLIQIFNDKELELIISGLPEIDLSDLKQNCIYTNYTRNDQEIIWLWEILEELDKNALANFIQFVTGTSKIPIGGFANLVGNNGPQKFHITRSYNKNHLPTSHTCFNQLDLPPYESKQIMRTKLLQAITEGSQGFGFA